MHVLSITSPRRCDANGHQAKLPQQFGQSNPRTTCYVRVYITACARLETHYAALAQLIGARLRYPLGFMPCALRQPPVRTRDCPTAVSARQPTRARGWPAAGILLGWPDCRGMGARHSLAVSRAWEPRPKASGSAAIGLAILHIADRPSPGERPPDPRFPCQSPSDSTGCPLVSPSASPRACVPDYLPLRGLRPAAIVPLVRHGEGKRHAARSSSRHAHAPISSTRSDVGHGGSRPTSEAGFTLGESRD